MSNIGFGELLLLFFVFLLFFGAKKLPGMARSLGRTVEQFRRAASDVREEFLRADQEETPAPHYEPPSTPETYGYPSSVTPGEPAAEPAAPAEASAPETPETEEGSERPPETEAPAGDTVPVPADEGVPVPGPEERPAGGEGAP